MKMDILLQYTLMILGFQHSISSIFWVYKLKYGKHKQLMRRLQEKIFTPASIY